MATWQNDSFNDNSIAGFWTTDTDTGGAFSESASTGYMRIYAGTGGLYGGSYDPCWIYQPNITGDFDIWSYIGTVASLTEDFQQLGLMFAVNSSNWVKISKYRWSQERYILVHTSGGSSDETMLDIANNEVYMRLKRSGSTITGYYSLTEPSDNGDWTQIAQPSSTLSSSSGGNFGLVANTQGGAQFYAYFNWALNWEPASSSSSSDSSSSSSSSSESSSSSSSSESSSSSSSSESSSSSSSSESSSSSSSSESSSSSSSSESSSSSSSSESSSSSSESSSSSSSSESSSSSSGFWTENVKFEPTKQSRPIRFQAGADKTQRISYKRKGGL